MRDAWKEASADDDVRCIVLTGTGGDFSAGMDLRSLAGDADEHDDWDVKGAMAEHGAAWIYEGLTKTYRPTKPIIAGRGCRHRRRYGDPQGTDIRIAAESAKFGVSEVRWSLYPAGGSPVRLPRQIGYAEAADILLTGKHITAAEAKAMGLISRAVPDGTAFEHALEVAEIVAGNGPLAVEAVLRTMHETSGMTEAEAWATKRLCQRRHAIRRCEGRPRAFARSAPRTSRRSSQVGRRPRSAGVAQSCGDAVDREQKRSLESGLLRRVDVGGSAAGEQVDLKDVDRVQVDVAHVEGAAQDRKIVEQFAARDEAELLQRSACSAATSSRMW